MKYATVALVAALVITPTSIIWAQDDVVVEEESSGLGEEFFDDTGGDFDEEAAFEDLGSQGFGEETFEETAEAPAPPVDEGPIEQQETIIETAPVDDFLDDTENFLEEAPPEPQAPSIFSQDFLAPEAPVSDDPDFELENKFHNIYKTFHSSRTADGDWNAALAQRQVESYVIQNRDTLWDISSTLFGDGNFWPKVWSLNADIKNPHLISPNNQIRFVFGTESAPPQFTVTQTGNAGTPTLPSNLEPGVEPEPEIPEPLRPSRPVLKRPPPSLPEWQNAGKFDNYDDLGVDYGKRKILDIRDEIDLSGYVAEKEPEALGRISEIEVGNRMASAYQYVYVAMKKGYAEVGDSYLAVRSRGPVQSMHPSITGDLGIAIDVQGEIQLVERVEGSDNEFGEVFRALVLRIVNPVTLGARIIEGSIEKIEVTENGPRSQVVAQIVGGSFFSRRQVYGVESIAYLNRGERDGLQVGQILPIRANMKVRKENTVVEENVRPIGWLRIVKTTPRLATAVIVRVWSDVLTGDLTGTGRIADMMTSRNGMGGDEIEGDLSSELDNSEVFPEDSGDGFDDSGFSDDFSEETDDFGGEEF